MAAALRHVGGQENAGQLTLLPGAAYYGAVRDAGPTRQGGKQLPNITALSSLTAGSAAHLVAAVLIALLALALGQRLRRSVIDVLKRRSRLDTSAALLVGRLVYFAVLVMAALWILNLWGSGITPLLTLLGVVGLTVSLALQDVLRNLFAGFYMLVERPFTIGDIIEVSGTQGAVESIELRLTVLTTLDGLRVTVPNATVFTAVVVNRSAHPFQRWPVLVTLPPGTSADAVQAAAAGLPQEGERPTPAASLAVQSASSKGMLLELGLWAPDTVALGRSIMALQRAVPAAVFSVPGAPALPAAAPPPAKARHISRTRRPRRNLAQSGKH